MFRQSKFKFYSCCVKFYTKLSECTIVVLKPRWRKSNIEHSKTFPEWFLWWLTDWFCIVGWKICSFYSNITVEATMISLSELVFRKPHSAYACRLFLSLGSELGSFSFLGFVVFLLSLLVVSMPIGIRLQFGTLCLN